MIDLNGGIAGRIVRAASAQSLNQLARIVQAFFLVPVCLTVWGTGAYEDWLLLNSIAAFLLFADLGLVQLTTVRLIEAWSREERDRFADHWARALGRLGALSAILVLLLGLFSVEPGWTGWIATRVLHGEDVALVVGLLSVMQVVSILLGLAFAVYRSRSDLSRSYHISSILVMLQTASVAGTAALGGGVLLAALVTSIVTLATSAAVVADLAHRYPDLSWRPALHSIGDLRSDLRAGIGYLGNPAASTIMMNGPNLILAAVGAPAGAIALFTASRTIAGVARQFPYQFAHPAGVELASLLARGDKQALSRLYDSASRALAMVVGVLSGFIVVAAPLVVTLWTRGKVDYDQELMLLLVGTTAICASSQVAFTMLWYGGYPGLLSRALVISTGLAIALAVLLAPAFEERGIAAGLGIGEVLGIGIYLPLLADRLLHRRAGAVLLQNFGFTVASFASSMGLATIIRILIEPRGWLGLVEIGIAWTMIAGAGLYWLVLSGPQRQRLASALK